MFLDVLVDYYHVVKEFIGKVLGFLGISWIVFGKEFFGDCFFEKFKRVFQKKGVFVLFHKHENFFKVLVKQKRRVFEQLIKGEKNFVNFFSFFDEI